MNDSLDPYLSQIRAALPNLAIDSAQLNADGMVNTVLIVNGELSFRFPKSEAGHALQRYEAALLAAIQPHLPVRVPQFELQTEQFAMYRFLPGEPLYRHTLLGASEADQQRVAEQLAHFLAQLHALPLAVLPPAPWLETALPSSARAQALDRLAQIQQQLYPHLWRDQRAWVEHLYAQVADGTLDLDAFTPRLVHNDLASYHLLVDTMRWELSGVIDFGTAAPGDTANDFALLLNTYGEQLLRRIHTFYPIAPETLDRARFRAGALELEWALAGVANNDPAMYLVHLGRARDMLPIGARWT